MSSLLQDEEFARRAEALRARLDAPPAESWRPEKPELGHDQELVGEFVRFEPFADRGYGEGRCAVVRDVGGQDWRILLKTVLESEFDKLGVDVGDLVAIRYLGLREPKGGGAAYHAWRVEVEKAQAITGSPPPFAGAPAAPAVPASVCEQCGFADGQHSAGCPDELPF